MTELVLGTAQFGNAYGVTNDTGRLTDSVVREIAEVASQAGIELFDTSPAYGDAQVRLGALVPAGPPRGYVSKFALEAEPTEDSLYGATLRQLGVSRLHGLLFHRTGDLRSEWAPKAWAILRCARAEGILDRIGASIYEPDDLDAVAAVLPGIDILQIPGNIIDRRLLDHPVIRRLHRAGVEIHVRSAFLQGLLLVDPPRIPDHLRELRPAVEALREKAEGLGVGVGALALGQLKHHPAVDAVVIGALSPEELRDSAVAWASDTEVELPTMWVPPWIMDPRQWAKRESA